MFEYEFVKWLHILSATLLFGTGLGSAFYKWYADRSGDLKIMAHTNKMVVIADWIFTTPTIIIQPISGIVLLYIMGVSFSEPWIVVTFVLYIVAGFCWLPVVWLQIRMRNIAHNALTNKTTIDPLYHRYARLWFLLGIPAFTSMITIYFLMVFKPVINL